MSSGENQLEELSKEQIQSKVIAIIEEMTADWELDELDKIKPETRLMEDLAFESIDVVHLVVALEQNFNSKDLPFHNLFMQEGDYVDEILVKEVSDFMCKNLPNNSVGST